GRPTSLHAQTFLMAEPAARFLILPAARSIHTSNFRETEATCCLPTQGIQVAALVAVAIAICMPLQEHPAVSLSRCRLALDPAALHRAWTPSSQTPRARISST